MRFPVPVRAALTSVLALTACHPIAPRSTEASVQRAALTELFLVRERAGEIVIWSDSTATGPILSAMGLSSAVRVATPTELPPSAVTLADIEAMFRDAPDGWRALYAQFPRTPGLVEVAPVAYASDRRRASVVIARSCGEHCRMAWQIQLTASDTTWTVERVRVLDPSRPMPPR